MLIDAQRSMLLVIDLQQKMLPSTADGEQVLANCIWLIRAAQRLDVPVAASSRARWSCSNGWAKPERRCSAR
jgi:nicotinamidase-related amidase